jgi:hypothetical protein
MELENERVKHTIMQLSQLVDLNGLSTHIAIQTYGGREPGVEPWENTRDYMQDYGDPANTDRLIATFESAGCQDEVEAVRWLLKNDNYLS